MIKYALTCGNGHDFEGWFASSDAYDKLASRGLLECEQCGSNKVEKQIMAPHIPAKSNAREPAGKQAMMMAPPDPRMQAMMQMMRAVRKHVEETAENVGARFADEARKIHYEEAEKRGIYGNATLDDAQALVEEGIEVFPLPLLPDDAN